MKIPNKLKIGGFTWEIKRDNKDLHVEGGCYGSTHYKDQKIFIEKEIPEDKANQALLHEILHALWWQQGLSSRKYSPELEEEIVHSLSMGLHQVLKDNNLI